MRDSTAGDRGLRRLRLLRDRRLAGARAALEDAPAHLLEDRLVQDADRGFGRLAASGLDADFGDAQQPVRDVSHRVQVLDPRIRHVALVAKDDARSESPAPCLRSAGGRTDSAPPPTMVLGIRNSSSQNCQLAISKSPGIHRFIQRSGPEPAGAGRRLRRSAGRQHQHDRRQQERLEAARQREQDRRRDADDDQTASPSSPGSRCARMRRATVKSRPGSVTCECCVPAV